MSKQRADAAYPSAGRYRSKPIAYAVVWWTFVLVANQALCAQDESARTAARRENASQTVMDTGREHADTTGSARAGQMSFEESDLSDSNNGASKEAGDAKVSDEDVKAAIQLTLQDSRFVLDDLSVRVDHGVVFLNGSVGSWLAKQRVSTLVWSVEGVADVVDAIDVRPSRFSVMPLED